MTAAATEVTARAEAAAAKTKTREAAALEAEEQALAALAQQKESLTEAHRLFELKFVAHRGAEVLNESSNAIATKVDMVEEARHYTILDESEYDTFDPDNLPSVSVVLQERKDAQDALREVLVAYEAGLKTTGTTDDDTGKFVRALSLPLLSPARTTEEGGSGADDRDSTSDDDATKTTTTTNERGDDGGATELVRPPPTRPPIPSRKCTRTRPRTCTRRCRRRERREHKREQAGPEQERRGHGERSSPQPALLGPHGYGRCDGQDSRRRGG